MNRRERLRMFLDAAPQRRGRAAPSPTMPDDKALKHCLFAYPHPACGSKVQCRRHDGIVRSVARKACRACLERVERLRISAVITARNEGDEVRATVQSLIDSVSDAFLEIIVVDDASTDGSCSEAAENGRRCARPQDLTVRIIRHKEPWGVGRSRNDGLEVSTGHVVSFHDAHMRFMPGALEALALKALTTRAVVCSACGNFKTKTAAYWGCTLFWNRKNGLQPKWIQKPPDEEFGRVPGMMGAGYVMSRATIDELTAPAGQLWEDTAGLWGHSEEALDVKAFLLDVPVLVSRDHSILHLFRKRNPLPNAGTEKWRNITRAMGLLLPAPVFEERFRGWCEKVLSPAEVKEILDGIEAVPRATWARDPEEIFTHLCGKGATVTEPHPDHAWLAQVRDTCGAFWKTNPGGKGARVLCWRPGEALLRVRRALPDAQIHAVECTPHRQQNWADLCKRHGIKLERIPLDQDYVERPLQWEMRDGRGYDLILIGGEVQDRCNAVARRLLNPGGTILANPTADRRQIEHEEIKNEQKMLEAAPGLARKAKKRKAAPATERPPTEDRPGKGAAPERHRPARPLVTVLLLNWRRPGNIGPILDRLAAQTVPLQVMVWNNGNPLTYAENGGRQAPLERHPLVAQHVQAAVNMRCWPRWLMASLATTEYVCTHDDDLAFRDERVLEDAVEAHRTLCPDGVVGFFGVEKVEGRPFKAWRHINGTKNGQNRWVDFVKGRFMLLRRAQLERVPLVSPPFERRPPEERLGDDINVCLSITRGRPGRCLVPGVLGKRWKELPRNPGVALAGKPGHYVERGRLHDRLVEHWERRRKREAAMPQVCVG